MKLTAKKIEKLKQPGRYGDGHGLYLQVLGPTNRSWLLRYERAGRERWMGLGPLHTFTLAQARDRARDFRQQIKGGTDPLEARKVAKAAEALQAAKAMTFKECTEAYYEFHESKWKNRKWRAQFMSTMRDYVFDQIGRLPVASIDTGLVLKCIEPIWKTKTATADRVRRRIAAVLDWATVRNYRSGDNPARWENHLVHLLPARGQIAKTEHHAALPYSEIPTFMAALRAREGIPARALELTVLTVARTGETIAARWSEIDLEKKVWTVPAGRIKGGREHRVPLSDRAIAILRSLPHQNDFVFPGDRHAAYIAHSAMDGVLKRMGGKGRATVHGFRSTFRDWAAETTGYPNHVVEMALAHAIGSKVEAAYRRGDLFDKRKRKRMMDDWARFCGTQPDAARASDNVTSLRAG